MNFNYYLTSNSSLPSSGSSSLPQSSAPHPPQVQAVEQVWKVTKMTTVTEACKHTIEAILPGPDGHQEKCKINLKMPFGATVAFTIFYDPNSFKNSEKSAKPAPQLSRVTCTQPTPPSIATSLFAASPMPGVTCTQPTPPLSEVDTAAASPSIPAAAHTLLAARNELRKTNVAPPSASLSEGSDEGFLFEDSDAETIFRPTKASSFNGKRSLKLETPIDEENDDLEPPKKRQASQSATSSSVQTPSFTPTEDQKRRWTAISPIVTAWMLRSQNKSPSIQRGILLLLSSIFLKK